jgi:Glycosyltransferase family 87
MSTDTSNYHKYLPKLLNIFLIFAIIITLFSVTIDLRNTVKNGGVDLRNRVVGARLLNQGLDPYFFKWKPGNDERLLDPLDHTEIKVSRVTVNPNILLFHSLFANLGYFPQRILWYVLQWFFLISSITLLFLRKTFDKLQTKFVLASMLIFFAGSSFWKLHVDVGQFYVVYVFLLSLAYYFFTSEQKFGHAVGGILIGLVASLRFPIIMMMLPMIIFKKIKMFTATLVSFCICLIASFFLAGSQVWQSYFLAMRTFGKLHTGSIPVNKDNAALIYPKVVEGMDNLRKLIDIPNADTSLQSLVKKITSFEIQSNYLILMLAGVLLLYSFLIYSLSRQNNHIENKSNLDMIFLIGTISTLIADCFIPAPKYQYNNIQLLIPFFLILHNVNFNIRMLSCTCLMFAGFLIMNGLFVWMPLEIELGEVLILISMILVSLMITSKISTDYKKQT